jgi:hypothetical protein
MRTAAVGSRRLTVQKTWPTRSCPEPEGAANRRVKSTVARSSAYRKLLSLVPLGIAVPRSA